MHVVRAPGQPAALTSHSDPREVMRSRWLRTRAWAVAMVLPLLGHGCSRNVPTTGEFIPPAEGIVYGEIRDTLGRLQKGAIFEVVVYVDDCNRPNPGLQGVPQTTPDGRYRVQLRGAPETEFAACLVVNASVESGTGVLRGTVRDQRMVFRSSVVGPPDSARVDVVVR